MSALFVTATGTDVGKTHLVEWLLARCRRDGRAAHAIKPLASGFDPQDWHSSDSARLLHALRKPLDLAAVERISPWRFRAALSPDMAARRERRAVPWEDLLSFCRSQIEQAEDVLLIEGAGGAMVPVDDRHTVCDWMAELGIPVVVVGGTYLGCMSHALTALAALQQRGIAVRALVLSESQDSPVPAAETAATLARFTAVPILTLARAQPDSAEEAELARILLG